MNKILFISEHKSNGIVYVVIKVEVPRGIKNKNSSKADEVLIFGFNKFKRPDLLKKYKEILKKTGDEQNDR